MKTRPARLELVHPFRNPSCPYCTGKERKPPREQYRAGNAHMTKAWTEEWDLCGSRHPGWFLHLVFHGLHEETQTLQMVLRLEGEGACVDMQVPAFAQVIEPQPNHDIRWLYGSRVDSRSLEERPSSVIRVGHHLVMGLDLNGQFRTATTVLPIAHLFHWFDNPAVG